MEAFAEAARVLLPDLEVRAIENVSFAAPFKFYRDEPREVTVTAVLEPVGDEFVAHCRLIGERLLPGSDTPQATVHFTGDVRLGGTAPAPDTVQVEAMDGPTLTPEQVYSFYFHGPAYQVVDVAGRVGTAAVATLAAALPPNHQPQDRQLATAPRLAELCFQTAGLWEAGTQGRLALPLAVERVRLLGDPSAAARAIAWPSGDGVFDCAVVADDGTVVLRLDGYRTVPLPGPIPESVRALLVAAYAG
jgi:Polyketide synthase dehydratase